MALLDTIQWFIPTYVGYTAAYRDSRRPRRFIPTYVGHTAPSSSISLVSTVHPHIRGAYMGRPAKIYVKNGSSPHTWGIRVLCVVGVQRLRFIPTYVGHTIRWYQLCRANPVHPHIRGAYKYFCFRPRRPPGSSPHTWGIRHLERAQRQGKRFIPTYVGHTPARCGGGHRPPVHPHIRGAYHKVQIRPKNDDGSSPHTWGIRRDLNGKQH